MPKYPLSACYLILLLLGLFAPFGFTQPKKTSALTADEILKKSIESYSSKKLYLDSGKVVSEFHSKERPHKSAIVFRTAYSASLGFNFEYYKPNKSNSLYTINKSGNLVRTWWGIKNKVDTAASLSMAIAAATGVSSGTAHIVPRLLMPQAFNKKTFYSGISASVLKTELVAGRKCYVISGTKNNEKLAIWISEQDFLIRKIVTDKIVGGKAQREKADSVFLKNIERLKAQLNAETDPAKRSKISSNIKRSEKLFEQIKSRNAKSLSEPFAVKTTYFYYPYQPKVLDKNLFSFRPNREVAI